MSKLSNIDCNPPGAEEATIASTGIAKLAATHEAGLADERARAVAQQTSGVRDTQAALEGALVDVKKRVAERERMLTGKLGAK